MLKFTAIRLPNVFRVSVIDDQDRCPLMQDNLDNSLQRARKTSKIVLCRARKVQICVYYIQIAN